MSSQNSSSSAGFMGKTVLAFENRQAAEIADLIRRHGGVPLLAAALQEVPLEGNPGAFSLYEKIRRGELDALILLTGVGARVLWKLWETKVAPADINFNLEKIALVVRGPKSAKALTDRNLTPTLSAPEPNTWREVLGVLDGWRSLKGLRIAVQEYGKPQLELVQALRDRGAAEVLTVPVYQWKLPADLGPLHRAIEALGEGQVGAVLFTSAVQATHLFQVAEALGRKREVVQALGRVALGSVGPMATEALRAEGLVPDWEPHHPKMGFLVKETAERFQSILAGKVISMSGPSPVPQNPSALSESLFLKACRKEKTDRTPVWLMRQAGRYQESYRKIRAQVSFLELCKTPALAAEVTVNAVAETGVDAAILFADLLLIAEPLGFKLEFAKDEGPVLHNPFRSSEDLSRVRAVDAATDLGYVAEAMKLCRSSLPSGIPLIGFAGAPFTLASYLIEGGGSKNYVKTKRLMMTEPQVWDAFSAKLAESTSGYLSMQVEAGCQAIQLFDSWVGCLSPGLFEKGVYPHLKKLVADLKLKHPGIPVIYFGTQTAPYFHLLKDLGAEVVGADWRIELDEAWTQLGDLAIQGNLDPVALYAPLPQLKAQAGDVLLRAAGRPGHIFNLGHGILPDTPYDHVKALVEMVHEYSPKA